MVHRDTPDYTAEEQAEAIMDKVYDILALAKTDTTSPQAEDAAQALYQMIGDAYSKGHQDGMADEAQARDYKESMLREAYNG